MAEQNASEDASKLFRTEGRTFISTYFLYCVSFLFFLLPIKFGNSFLASTIPSYPESLIFGGWPSYFLSIIAGFFLIIAIILYRPKRVARANVKIIAAWFLVGVTTAAFGYYKYNLLYYFYSINQIIIALLLAILVAICLECDPRSRKFFIAAICSGLLYTCLNGVYQYWWGFEDNIRLYKEMAAQGAIFPPAHVSRIMQKLVFSHFTISNSFAAHIILTLPITVFIILTKLGKKNLSTCRIFGASVVCFSLVTLLSSDQALLAVITMIVGMLLCFGIHYVPEQVIKVTGYVIILVLLIVLALTRSRAGMSCLGAGLLVSGIICFKGKARMVCSILLLVGLVAGFYFAPKVASFQVRLGYYEALVAMFKEKPMGYGFGGFSEFYNRTKGPGIEESNSPHSFFFGYLGQGGLLAGLSVLLCGIISVYTMAYQQLDKWLKFCLIGGFSAWFLHSQLDFNIMIPGTVALAALIPMLGTRTEPAEKVAASSFSVLFISTIPAVVVLIYFATDHAYAQRQYTLFYEMVNNVQNPPPVDRVKNVMGKVAEGLPDSTAVFDEASSWAVKQYASLRDRDTIQAYTYLNFAEEALNKAIDIDPRRSSFYTRLARIYFDMKNFDQTRAMLDKAFELYPYNTAALTLEYYILTEWSKRDPQNIKYLIDLLRNRVRNLEITLGRMTFHDHLMIAPDQLRKMYDGLEEKVKGLQADIALLSKTGITVELKTIADKINKIHAEAQKIITSDN